MRKLKFFLLGLCMIFALMACEDSSVAADNTFLGRVAGKEATALMGPSLTVTLQWTADGKSFTFTVPGTPPTVATYTFKEGSDATALAAIYLDNTQKDVPVTVSADSLTGTMTTARGTITYTFQ